MRPEAEPGQDPPAARVPTAQDWSWLHEVTDRPTVDPGATTVTAVLVAHNGARWLPDALAAIAALTVRPGRIIAADAASTDETPGLLAAAAASGVVDAVHTVSDAGFGLAVAEALEADKAPPGQWLWLLHDDAVPEPEALAELITAAVRSESPDSSESSESSESPPAHRPLDVIGPLLLRPRLRGHPVAIGELGVSISDTGRRELGLEPGEIDQKQREASDVLGVGTCGMFVRRTVFDGLGGLDSELGVFRDGVAFGWRANLAGHRVGTAPRARITHRQAGREGERESWVIGEHPAATDRALGMMVISGHRSGPAALGTAIRLVWGVLLRAIGFLLGKDPASAANEFRALRHWAGSRAVIDAVRERNGEAAASPADRQRTRALRPPPLDSWRVGADAAGRSITNRWRRLIGEGERSSIDELTGDAYAEHSDSTRPAWQNPIGITFALLVLASLTAGRELIGPGVLSGPQLLPSRPDLAAAYGAYLDAIPGSAAMAPPWLGLTALAATLTLGQPELLTSLLAFGCVPLSFLTGWLFVRPILASRAARWGGPLAYAALLPALGGLNRGALGAAVVSIVLPLLAISVRRMVRPADDSSAAERWRPAWSAAVFSLIIIAALPSFVVLTVLGALVLLIVAPGARARAVAALVAPLVLLAPWLPGLAAGWGRLLTGPDGALALLEPTAGGWPLLIGQTPGAGAAPWWLVIGFFGLIWLAALVGVAGGPSRLLLVGLGVAPVGFAMAALPAGWLLRLGPGDAQARADALTWLLIAFAGLVLAGTAGANALSRAGTTHPLRGIGKVAVSAGAVIAAAGVLAGAGWWVAGGLTGPIQRGPAGELPPFMVNAMRSEVGVRVLAIDLTGAEPAWSLIEGEAYRLGDADRGYAFGGDPQLRALAAGLTARLLGGSADEAIVGDLNRLGVGYLWVRGADGDEVIAQISNVPGLGPGSGERGTRVWTVPSTVGRAVLIGAADPQPIGRTGTVIAPGGERTLVLAEPVDRRWVAELDGRPLAPVPGPAGQPAFAVGTQGGLLTYRLDNGLLPGLALAQLIALLVLIVLAAPTARRGRAAAPEVRPRRVADDTGDAREAPESARPAPAATPATPEPVTPAPAAPAPAPAATPGAAPAAAAGSATETDHEGRLRAGDGPEARPEPTTEGASGPADAPRPRRAARRALAEDEPSADTPSSTPPAQPPTEPPAAPSRRARGGPDPGVPAETEPPRPRRAARRAITEEDE